MSDEVDIKIEQLKKEISLLSSNLKVLGDKKEIIYGEKKGIDLSLNKLIGEASALKTEKQTIDEKIKALKQEREKSNNKVKELADKLRQLKVNKRQISRTADMPDVNFMKKQLERLEYQLQTEVVKFEKEKKLMAAINEIKAKVREAEGKFSIFREIPHLRKEIKKVKREADAMHNEIQELANKSSTIFDDLTKRSKMIYEVKDKRNGIQDSLKTIKLQINSLNQKLATILKMWSEFADKVETRIKAHDAEAEDVKEKLKSKKKLTTEDILKLQRQAMQK